MPKFYIEQVALCPPDPVKAIEFLKEIGMEDWARDHVIAAGSVYGKPGTNGADLAFNYDGLKQARELEVLHYTDGPNWMDDLTRGPSVSHLGMHVTADELEEWRKFFAQKGIVAAQDVFTKSHTNPFLVENGRKYNYAIFDTRAILGVDLKFIVRVEK